MFPVCIDWWMLRGFGALTWLVGRKAQNETGRRKRDIYIYVRLRFIAFLGRAQTFISVDLLWTYAIQNFIIF